MDALTTAAEELAPARATTNFFDPTQGRDVISRYAGTKIAAEGTAALMDATSRLNASRIDRAEARRRATMFDRDEREYEDKQNFKAQRGELAIQLANLDEKADDYDTVLAELVAEMPEEALGDEVVKAILTRKNQLRDDHLAQKEKRDYAGYTFDQRRQMQQEKALAKFAEMGLPPEQIVRDAEGNVDEVETAYLAGRAESTEKKEDSKELMAERAKLSSEARATKQAELDRRKTTMEVGVADQGAFPSQMAMLLKKYPKMTEADIEEDYPQEYLFAKSYEDKKLNSEMATALASDDAEAYVNRFPNATESQKKKRRALWQLAHDMRGNAEPEATEESAAPGADAAPAPVAEDKFIVGETYTDAAGNTATYKGNGKWD